MALEYKLEASNTLERIKLLVDQGNLESQLGHDTAEALGFLLEMRLKAGLDMLANGKTPSNQIQPDRLSTLERDLLKGRAGGGQTLQDHHSPPLQDDRVLICWLR